MTKDVLLSIQGLQMIDGDENPVELMIPAEYYLKNDKHYVLYEETVPDMPAGTVKNIIKISGRQVDIMKKGAINAQLIFADQKKMQTCYSTPLGDLLVGIHTHQIQIDEADGRMDVAIEYLLEINGQDVAECAIHILIQAIK